MIKARLTELNLEQNTDVDNFSAKYLLQHDWAELLRKPKVQRTKRVKRKVNFQKVEAREARGDNHARETKE